jgi:hypothetical protein
MSASPFILAIYFLLACYLLCVDMKLNSLQLSTVWKNSYKSGEWRPCINKSSEGMSYV